MSWFVTDMHDSDGIAFSKTLTGSTQPGEETEPLSPSLRRQCDEAEDLEAPDSPCSVSRGGRRVSDSDQSQRCFLTKLSRHCEQEEEDLKPPDSPCSAQSQQCFSAKMSEAEDLEFPDSPCSASHGRRIFAKSFTAPLQSVSDFRRTVSSPDSAPDDNCSIPNMSRRLSGLMLRRNTKSSLLQEHMRIDVGLSSGFSSVTELGDRYELLKKLGHGSTSVVYRARRKRDGEEVVVKNVPTVESAITQICDREHRLLCRLAHPGIIKSLEFFSTSSSAVLELEFFSELTLWQAVKNSVQCRLAESDAQVICRKTFVALSYLHAQGVLHRDVKADNVLVSPCLKDMRLIDFNAAVLKAHCEPMTMTGSFWYAAPEVLKGKTRSESSDVWGAGLCLYFSITGELPWQAEQYPSLEVFSEVVAAKPVTLKGRYWKSYSEPCKSAVRSILVNEELLRPSAALVLESEPWLCS